ncbi:hypothetical protein K443DRAFT_115216, partial [Laccaria amethystina LaAM-08-1]
QYLGRSWTGCGPRLRVLGAKNRTEPDLKTLLTIHKIDYLMHRYILLNLSHISRLLQGVKLWRGSNPEQANTPSALESICCHT